MSPSCRRGDHAHAWTDTGGRTSVAGLGSERGRSANGRRTERTGGKYDDFVHDDGMLGNGESRHVRRGRVGGPTEMRGHGGDDTVRRGVRVAEMMDGMHAGLEGHHAEDDGEHGGRDPT